MPERFLSEAFQTRFRLVSSSEEFRAYFAQFGEIVDILLPLKSKKTRQNNGYGFVTYRHPESARYVIDNSKKHTLRAKWIDVKIANPRNSTSPNAKAFQERYDEDRKDFFNIVQVPEGNNPYPEDQSNKRNSLQ